MMLRITVESVFANLAINDNVGTPQRIFVGDYLASISPELCKLVDDPEQNEVIEV